MAKKKAIKRKKTVYFWECHWTNGKGAFHPDLECCRTKGKKKFDTPEQAAIAGYKHAETHGWCGWGYAPLGWFSQCVCVYKLTPTGRVKCVLDGRKVHEIGSAHELNE